MPDYAGAIGGALKLKGVSKITKSKKREKARPKAEEPAEDDDARPQNLRRTSGQNDEPERPQLTRRRTSAQSDPTPSTKTESPSQERIRSPDPRHQEPEWRTKPSLDREDSNRQLSPGRSKTFEPEQSLAEALKSSGWSSKTEAERRHEERKKKRLEEKMRREGVKTHKERVEEFNKKLAEMSEHHDMPRIGPG